MRPEWVAAERARVVREAFARWSEAGLVKSEVAREVAQLFPDDRVRAARAMAVLSAIFAAVAGVALLSLVATWTHYAFAAFVVAPLAAVAVELLMGPGRRKRSGVEEGVSVVFVIAVALAGFWLFDQAVGLRAQTALRWNLVHIAAACCFAWARWGMPLWAAPASVFGFCFLASSAHGRWLLLGTALALTPVLSYGSKHPRLAPSHRVGLAIALAIALAGAYLAINLQSLDERWIEALQWPSHSPPQWAPIVRLAAIAGTALLPLAVLARGVASRDRLLVGCGALLAAASCVTVRAYVHIAPTWLLLVGAGGTCLGFALLLRRWLDGGPGRERGGFTAAELGSGGDPQRVGELVAVLATLTPAAPAPQPPRPRTGGGEFGGGGASAGF